MNKPKLPKVISVGGRPPGTRRKSKAKPPTDDFWDKWAALWNRPEHRLLALADIGARESHYVYAGKFPEHYPGHSGGSLTCPHADCRMVYEAILAAIRTRKTKEKS